MDVAVSDFKKPQVWAVIVPIVLLIWALGAFIGMSGNRRIANRQIRVTRAAQKEAAAIAALKQEAGVNSEVGARKRFDPVTSARECAIAAGIPEERIPRGVGAKPIEQKDGSLLFRETYKLNSVRLLQAVQFIDHAERHYAALSCTQISLTPVRSKTRDSWDVTVDLQYLKD